MKSARLLIKDGDYEFTFVITKEEAEEILGQGQNFITSIIKYLKESGHDI